MVFTIVRLVIDWIIDAYITVLFVRMILDWVSVLAPRWYPKGRIADQCRLPAHRAAVALAATLHPAHTDGAYSDGRQLHRAVHRTCRLENIGVNRAVITHTARVLSGFVLASEGDTNTARHRAQSEV